jgi:trans-2,3-dihydro-3-hydroxyanthranilate isomerase
MRRSFATLDVFSERRFSGNPLAVVLDAGGLDAEAMQAIAREFNHPETVFVFSPANPPHRARLRIFTPARELPFAGHPTVGTAVLLGLRDAAAPGCEFVLEEEIGSVPCRAEAKGPAEGFARFTIPRLPEPAGAAAEAGRIAAALGLRAAEIGFDDFRPSRWSAGNPFTFVPVAGLGTIGRCRSDPGGFSDVFGLEGVYIFCRETVGPGNAFHARMFAPALGIAEDPATGSAAAALAGLLAGRGALDDGMHAFVIEQGYEMSRPSLIELEIEIASGKLTSVSIGGSAVVVTEGTLEA